MVTGLSLDDLLTELRRRKWTLYLFGRPDSPDLYAATCRWLTYTDVLIIRDEHHATAYRTPTFPDTDVFRPSVVSWQYGADPLWTLRAVLTIGAPGQADAPFQVLAPAPDAGVPLEMGRPVTIRPTGLVQDPKPKTAW
ncbi:hypothetical protein VA596_04320 [Amycolatopsis sp., V23-08]|uniref:DUF4262 domain-containing protein n=1 Tax=Amycolatopsis heterodermiae TaxID=3110235 RepID=A0ABU5QZ12_9PSEU|nr:hypothetical protein [Amycolatopsis sp., V23-08]MEA5358750.1 hypothetical protein [Amycolatopsis sp., V23-08]